MSSLSIIEDNGECVSCKKNVGNAYVVCLFCKKCFHAVNCAAPTSICTSSFHQLYKPLTDKTGVNANKAGRFLWACDICMTNFEVNQVKTDNNRIQELQAEVSTLAQGMRDIKNMLGNKCINPGVTEECLNASSHLVNDNSPTRNDWSKSVTDLKVVENSSNSIIEKPSKSNNKSAMNSDGKNVKTLPSWSLIMQWTKRRILTKLRI